jgi:ABC-type multidrug transport system ATPase subunit
MSMSQQDAALFSHLTVWESILFPALFRMTSTDTLLTVMNNVTKLVRDVGLTKIMHRLVGGVGKENGLSTGERHRLLISQQLTSNPSVLCIDDPSRGLDGHQSQSMMELLKNLASEGRVVICTLNQPRYT